jgi:hypothetical protein
MALTTTPAELTATALTLTTAAQPNITSVGTLSALTVSGNLNATLTTAAQTNITSLGTLTALTGGTGDLIWDTDTLVVDSSTDRVGIGDTSPFSKLHVEDTGWSSGSPYGTVAYIQGGATNDANWGHLLISQSGTTTDTGGRLAFGANGENPIAGIRAKYKGATYGDLAFSTRPSGGTNTERMVISSTGATTITGPVAATFTVKSTDGAGSTPGPHIILRRDSASPADGDDVGELQWIGKNNADQDVTLAMMRTWNRSVTDGSEGSSFGLYDRQGGTQTGILFADNNEIHLNHSGVARSIKFRGEGSVYSRIAHHSYGMSFETTTSDGSDNMSVSLDAGSGGGSNARGAWWGCYGNEATGNTGNIVGQLGAAGHYKLLGGSSAQSFIRIDQYGSVGFEKANGRVIVGAGYNTTGLYGATSASGIGFFGHDAYSSCGAHIETSTDGDTGWSPFYVNKFNWGSGDDARWLSFGVNGYGTDSGTIAYDGTNFAIVNASDYRLKENIVDYSGGLAKLEELKVRTYNKKEGVSKHITQQGFIAHEAATANIPGFISGEKDAMKTNEAGETVPDYQTVNKEALIPYLVSAIQELSAKVKELESK